MGPEPFGPLPLFKGGLAELVIFGPLFLITEDFIRLVYLFEFLFSSIVSGIQIGISFLSGQVPA